jgi:hypothetical protein
MKDYVVDDAEAMRLANNGINLLVESAHTEMHEKFHSVVNDEVFMRFLFSDIFRLDTELTGSAFKLDWSWMIK